ncbi:M48 family metallopeptidase [Cellvibrio japonicus]|uniref:Peptidase, M48 family n=1 Tax=Cellvibrio japonicus (strain Ueda107) TaxID=498211 RepID=B3PJP8_CELJU|nr:M48 family metallopeptidase [Cellvibrio japonicus]ACE84876.1 peptidase, M48 family [Cellvibrio japonicus Ueda107]QEI11328.1 M48 family metallopeptidase [Cellvibrio japonicus]QEI14902.1 M48 family metallopeptidase [Cellvibrio japonicus]QEI18482.1 M48 family metallopeptidase [Cellvibrio japonicus]
MFRLQGDWFDGKTSAHQSVTMEVNDNGTVRIYHALTNQCLLQVEFSELDIASRVGTTPRYIYFPQGEKLETSAHDEVDALLHRFRPSLFNTLAHKLESHLQFVLLTLVIVAGMTWWTVIYGLPLGARLIADALPPSVMNRASTETLAILDKMHFVPSQLDDATRERVLEHFAPALEENRALNIRVLFRGGGNIGANAFALPDGTVVFTDEIVHLAHNDDELLAVLAHEIGHVRYRHGLRATIQGAVLSFAISMLIGDVSAAGELLASLPLLLTTSSYSRDFEREADLNSLHFLDSHQVPRHSFIDLMERLTYNAHCSALIRIEKEKQAAEAEEHERAGDSEDTTADVDGVSGADQRVDQPVPEQGISPERREMCDKLMAEHKKDSLKILDYFSSHPETEERVKLFRAQPAAH